MKYDLYIANLLNEMKCWKGYKKVGTKKGKKGKRVNDCVKIKK
jgi:hypothetical protein